MAANAAQLDEALASAFKVIESTYAFATSSVQSVHEQKMKIIFMKHHFRSETMILYTSGT